MLICFYVLQGTGWILRPLRSIDIYAGLQPGKASSDLEIVAPVDHGFGFEKCCQEAVPRFHRRTVNGGIADG
jgi:hypothetical protein